MGVIRPPGFTPVSPQAARGVLERVTRGQEAKEGHCLIQAPGPEPPAAPPAQGSHRRTPRPDSASAPAPTPALTLRRLCCLHGCGPAAARPATYGPKDRWRSEKPPIISPAALPRDPQLPASRPLPEGVLDSRATAPTPASAGARLDSALQGPSTARAQPRPERALRRREPHGARPRLQIRPRRLTQGLDMALTTFQGLHPPLCLGQGGTHHSQDHPSKVE